MSRAFTLYSNLEKPLILVINLARIANKRVESVFLQT